VTNNGFFIMQDRMAGRRYSVFCQLLLGLICITVAAASHGATFVGVDSCKNCHQAEYRAWKNSHHDLAMQPANAKAVPGDFDNARLTQFGVTSFFSALLAFHRDAGNEAARSYPGKLQALSP
jgi:hypothetical protein